MNAAALKGIAMNEKFLRLHCGNYNKKGGHLGRL
jgi:hypothetical protein